MIAEQIRGLITTLADEGLTILIAAPQLASSRASRTI